ncbi:YtxH domain-containing protein [Aquibacillus albus]|uniref:Gas vesicle protein n=1 Tax=Aquibacillus albus TaxID=1168171 RepID=A0ABS2N012_9BACI|nr:YtxH domain-containing protein [Aquibacillus albus]MBM7571454.1 gas vesicle protein [Aquibacillus albus]
MVSGKSLLLGFITGGLVSATATLLSTPTSGKKLRNQARYRSEEIVHSFEKIKNDGLQITDQLAKTSKEGVSLLKDLSAEMKASIESWKNTIAPHQKNIQTYLTQIEQSLKELEEKTKQQNAEAENN